MNRSVVNLIDKHPSSSRWLFVDLFRFCAVVLMIQGHSFHALLDISYRTENWFGYHSFWHGFTAPMFMFASGVAFGIATTRKWSIHTTWGSVPRDRIIRYVSLLLIGYFLHLPFFSLSKIRSHATPELFDKLFSFDALHLIGFSLLLLQLGVLLLKRKRVLLSFVVYLVPVLLAISPFIWRNAPNFSISPIFEAMLSSNTGSQFPIFPWSIYVFAGFLAAFFLRPDSNQQPPLQRLRWLLIVGLSLIVVAGAISLFDGGLPGRFSKGPLGFGHEYFGSMHWNVNPLVVLFKSGFLLVFLVLLFLLESGLGRKTSRVLSWIQKAANQTLAIYVFHLMLLYGSPLNLGFRYLVGPNQMSLLHTSLFTLLFTSAMLAFGVAWNYFRKNRSIPDRAIKVIVSLVLLYLFLTNPF